MTIELPPSLTNVVRFPLDQWVAPSVELIVELQPDWREVEQVAEAFHLELPPFDLAQQVDAETTCCIAEQVLPLTPSEQTPALDALLRPVVARAVAACRQAGGMRQQATRAHEQLLAAQMQGGSWLDLLEEQADALTQQAAELLLLAHQRCQEARGVARAVDLARRGKPWVPCEGQAATLTMLEDERRSRARTVAHAG